MMAYEEVYQMNKVWREMNPLLLECAKLYTEIQYKSNSLENESYVHTNIYRPLYTDVSMEYTPKAQLR